MAALAIASAVWVRQQGFAVAAALRLEAAWACAPAPTCAQDGAVLRVGYATVAFFAAHAALCWASPRSFDLVKVLPPGLICCVGPSPYTAVLRLFFLFFSQAAPFFPGSAPQAWGLKAAAFVGLAAATAWVPARLLAAPPLLWPLRVAAAAFLALQAVAIAGAAAALNNALVALDDELGRSRGGSGGWGRWRALLVAAGVCLLLLTTCSLGALSAAAGSGGGGGGGGGGVAAALMVAACVAALAPVLVQLATPADAPGSSSLLASSSVAAYSACLAAASLPHYDGGDSNGDGGGGGGGGGNHLGLRAAVAAFAMAAAALATLPLPAPWPPPLVPDLPALPAATGGAARHDASAHAYGTIELSPPRVYRGAGSFTEKDGREEAAGRGGTGGGGGTPSRADDPLGWAVAIVHALGASAWAAALSDWGGAAVAAAGETGGEELQLWYLAASCGAGALYLWTIVAPRIFPGRDFT